MMHKMSNVYTTYISIQLLSTNYISVTNVEQDCYEGL